MSSLHVGEPNKLLMPAATLVYEDTISPTAGSMSTISPATTTASDIESIASSSLIQSGSRSRSTRIGIGVGVSIGGALMLLAFGVIYFRLRRARAQSRPSVDQDTGGEKAELDGAELPRHVVCKELVDAPVYEIEDTSSPVEMGTSIKDTIAPHKEQSPDSGKADVGPDLENAKMDRECDDGSAINSSTEVAKAHQGSA